MVNLHMTPTVLLRHSDLLGGKTLFASFVREAWLDSSRYVTHELHAHIWSKQIYDVLRPVTPNCRNKPLEFSMKGPCERTCSLFSAVDARRLEHEAVFRPDTKERRKTNINSSYIHVPTFWNLLQVDSSKVAKRPAGSQKLDSWESTDTD